MVSSICFTTFLLISIFFFFSEAAIDEVLVPPKYGLLDSARISSEVKKEVGVSSIVEARELIISRKMKLIINRKALDQDVSDRNVEEGDRKLEASASGSHREKKIAVRDDHHHLHGVGHNLEMRSRGGAKRRSRGFVAFSADYHIPKPHPPRNN